MKPASCTPTHLIWRLRRIHPRGRLSRMRRPFVATLFDVAHAANVRTG
ncbi:MAG: hypothetical protein R6W76_16750 [Caldilinea sp.]